MSFWDRFKSKENSYARDDRRLAATEANARLAKYDLERENRLAQAKATISKSRSESRTVRHPHAVASSDSFKRAGKQSLKFLKERSEDSAKAYGAGSAVLQKRAKSYKRGRGIRAAGKVYGGGSFSRPDGSDTSLSGGIARADWAGERNVMSTEFFGEREQRDILGTQRDKQWNMDIFGTNTKETNLIGNNKKKNNFY